LVVTVLRTQDHVFCSRPQQYTARGMLYGCRDIAFSPYGGSTGARSAASPSCTSSA
jgi:hypothetical protein